MHLYKYDCYIDEDLVIYRTRESRSNRAGCLFQPKIYVNDDGYPVVGCYVKGKPRPVAVHRIVAEAFIPNTDNLPTVDHINRDKLDYRVENLRWADYQTQNNNRMFAISSQEKYGWKGHGLESKDRIREVSKLQCAEYRKTHVRVTFPDGTRKFFPVEETMKIPSKCATGFRYVLKSNIKEVKDDT